MSTAGALPGTVRLQGVALPLEVGTATDLPGAVSGACAAAGAPVVPGTILCIASKVVSKWLGLTSADRDSAVAAGTRALLARRLTPRGLTVVVRSWAGPVLAGAGVDESNTGPSGGVLRLPDDPDAVARRLRSAVATAAGVARADIGVVITDTAGRPWRDGQVDFALGAAGVSPVDDLRGARDADGRPLEVTVRATADALAAAAELVRGKNTGVPIAHVTGLPVIAGDGPGASRLVRDPAEDWFALGAVEACHAALGADPAAVDPPVPARLPDQDPARALSRAATVAMSGEVTGPPGTADVAVTLEAHGLVLAGDPFAVGRTLERVLCAARAERLDVSPSLPEPTGSGAVRVVVATAGP